MKRFLVLAWDNYNPACGLESFKGHFDLENEAEEFATWLATDYNEHTKPYYENVEIIDTHNFKMDGCYELFVKQRNNRKT